ncbi:MAG: 1-deoxy-D-xylulose-5-phosphate synthase [Opitutaceae bacterium]
MSDSKRSPDPAPAKTPVLGLIRNPGDLRKLPESDLPRLAQEIRDRLIAVTSVNGGHLGPNLGVVELTIGLHRVFDSPRDNLIFDVAHQGYVHKLLTGRNDEKFSAIRRSGGYSGFLTRTESQHDCYGAGHAGTALSAALGMATARDLRGTDEHVIAVLGDAALTCGITMEALNNIATSTKRLIVILNDNEWSIARNVGALSKYLTEMITNPVYNRMHDDLESFLKRVPGGNSLIRIGGRAKVGAKSMMVPSSLFEKYGLRYLGPIDGHDLEQVIRNLEFAKHSDQPIVIHLITKKGKGYPVALKQPERFHGTSPFDPDNGQPKASTSAAPPTYQDVFGETLTAFARNDPKVVGITAAMPSGTGLSHLAEALPKQFFDVGIAEEHAVLFAAGLATKGFHPVCAIYSTFLQRAVDPIIHDICLQNLPVTFCMDRAGLSPNDGPTHHGLFDIAYLRGSPNTIIMQPKDEDELIDMLHTGIKTPSPTFIRYPRGASVGVKRKSRPAPLAIGESELIRPGTDIMIWALGPMVADAVRISDHLLLHEGFSVGVVNARFAKPIDRERLIAHAGEVSLIVTMEDHALAGGFGSAVLETLQDAHRLIPVERIGWPDTFVDHGSSPEILRAAHGLSFEDHIRRVTDHFRRLDQDPVEAMV